MARHGNRQASNDGGFVLVIILWVVAMLTVMTLSIGQRAVLEVKAARYTLDHARARMMARAAVHRGMLEMQHKGINDYVEAYENPDIQRGTTHLGQAWAERVEMLGAAVYFEERSENPGDTVFYQIEDLAGRIDINRAEFSLLTAIEQLDGSVRRRISAERARGARNRDTAVNFHSLEELRYIEGMTDEDWFGQGREPGVRDLFTVWGDRNTEGRININTAPLVVLAAIPGIGESGARAMLRYRGGDPITGTGGSRPFNSLADVSELIDVGIDELEPYCMLSSTYFKIKGVATLQGGRVRASCTAVVQLDLGQTLLKSWHEGLLGGQIQ